MRKTKNSRNSANFWEIPEFEQADTARKRKSQRHHADEVKVKEKNEKEDEFVCRTYGKSELAQLYCPDIEPKTAVAKLNQWIALKPGLKEALANTGLQHCAKQYTPAQVRLIVDALGEP